MKEQKDTFLYAFRHCFNLILCFLKTKKSFEETVSDKRGARIGCFCSLENGVLKADFEISVSLSSWFFSSLSNRYGTFQITQYKNYPLLYI